MKRLFLLTGMSLSMLTAGAQASPPETIRMSLEDCLEYALTKNYSRQSVKLNEATQESILEQSKSERLPSLSASANEQFSHNSSANNSSAWNGNYSLSTGVTVFQGGNITQTIKQNELYKEQTQYKTTQYDNDLTISILQSFLTALGNEELLKYQQAVLTASEEQVKQGRELYKVGRILESDYLLLEAQLAADKNNIVQSTINRDNSLLALKSLLSIDPTQPFDIISPDTAAVNSLLALPSESQVLERAVSTMPDIQISNYNVEIAQTGLKISRAAFFPTISMSGSVGTGHNRNFLSFGDQLSERANQQVGLTVSVPIFNKNRTKARVTQSQIALEQARLVNKQTEIDIRQNILQEYRNVVASGSNYEASDVRRNAYLRSFEAYRAKFEAGSITTVDLLQQQNNYINAMNDFIRNKYGFMLNRKVLDVYMGERITM